MYILLYLKITFNFSLIRFLVIPVWATCVIVPKENITGVFYGQMLFMLPNQQQQSTEGPEGSFSTKPRDWLGRTSPK